MSFVEKIVENKQMIMAALGGLTAGLILYKLVLGKSKEETAQERRFREIQKLKKQINAKNPSFEDVKKVMNFVLCQARKKVLEYSHDFKEKRMKFTKETRKQNIKDYLNLISQGMAAMQMIAVQQQQLLLARIGMNEGSLQKYRGSLEGAIQQIIIQQNKDTSHIKPIKLQEAKFAIKKQIDFIRTEGLQYAQLMIDSTKDWPNQKRAVLPMLLSMVVTDCAFEGYLQLDEQSVQHAQDVYQKQLMGDLQQLQIAMTPMMLKLNSALRQNAGFDLSDLSFGSGIGFSPEQINQLRSLQNLRELTTHSLNDFTAKIAPA